jgi:hypothetical protein
LQKAPAALAGAFLLFQPLLHFVKQIPGLIASYHDTRIARQENADIQGPACGISLARFWQCTIQTLSDGGFSMMDVVYIALNIIFFGASIVFIYALEGL